ncbi:MAG TPA: type II toxin-antitoxin system VapC family toxin [Conexibacter sp.]|nr:type II toxin-antitoxin system VapC family toxin [Conexibacter sp.]
MIAYVDSSLIARAYLEDEAGSADARRLIADRSIAKYTGRWTRIEVSGAIVRAARAGRLPDPARSLKRLDAELRPGGRIDVIAAPDEFEVEARALAIAREHGLRALDALHVALASIAIPKLADKGEPIGFASRDGVQATVAESLGFASV